MSSSGTLQTSNPFSHEPLKSYRCQTIQEALSAADEARAAQKEWAQLPLAERVKWVQEGLQYFRKNEEQIAKDISEQMGRPLSQAAGELGGFFERAEYMCAIAEESLAPDSLPEKPNTWREIDHVPLGVVFTISAWNYPLLVAVNSVIPALIAGNTVLLKHSSRTLEIGEHFERAFFQMGSHQHLLKHLVLDHEVTGKLIEKGPIDHVVFTGSVGGGREVLSHCARAKKFLMPQLELGGKDAAYVAEDADVEAAAASVVDGAVFNSGQSCCGLERAYVHSSIYDTFIKKCQELMESYVLGDPSDAKTNLGPLANASAADLMQMQVSQAVEQGASLTTGGHKKEIGPGVFFEPTLLENVTPEMAVMREENFGPILPVVKVGSMEEAVQQVNDSSYGLTAAIYTKNKDRALEFAQQVETGTVFMNRCDYLDPALPWTGIKNSGCGSSLSKYGYLGLTRRKSLNFNLS